jgi:thioredoxin-related protein
VLAAATALLAASLAMGAEGSVWMTDFKAAKEKAAKEKKDILVNFSGSDWCGWCIKLDKEVFSQEAFLKEAPKHFVLVVLDFPKKPENVEKIPAEQRKENEKLMQEFGVEGFPTIFLIKANGKPYAQRGYEPGGPEKYVKDIISVKEKTPLRDKLLAKAATAQGMERAKLLDQALQNADESILDKDFSKEMAEIVQVDSANAAGLKAKYDLRLRLAEAAKAKTAKDPKKAIEIYDSIVKDLKPSGEALQDVLFNKGEAYFNLKDMGALVAALKEALAAAPDSKKAPAIKQMIERFSQTPKEPVPAPQEKPAPAPQEKPAQPTK